MHADILPGRQFNGAAAACHLNAVAWRYPQPFQIGGREPTVGREALAEIVRRRADGARHVTTNMLIEGDGNAATMRAYLEVLRAREVSVTGSYTDTLVKVDGQWLFEHRLFTGDD